MAFKRPPPAGFEDEMNRLQKRSAELKREFAEFFDDCDRFLRQARLASLTHKEAVAQFLGERPGEVFGSRQIQKALEAEGWVFSDYYTVSGLLSRLQSDRRVVQISHGKWTVGPAPGSPSG